MSPEYYMKGVMEHDEKILTEAIRFNDNQTFVNYLLLRKDAIVESKTVDFNLNPNESKEERLLAAIIHLQKEFQSNVKELIVPFSIEHPKSILTITVPKQGIKRKLLNPSKKNIDHFSDTAAQHSGIEIMKNGS